MSGQVGWLVWRRINGQFSVEKLALQAYPSFPETVRAYQLTEVQREALSAEDWKFDLEQLRRKFPLRVGVKENVNAP